LTQLSLYGKAAGIEVKETRLEQVMHFYTKGSIREKTVENGCLGLETHVDVTSDEPPEHIRELIRMGERMCYTVQSLSDGMVFRTRASLNGEDLLLGEPRDDR
jgi:hypothetical protein